MSEEQSEALRAVKAVADAEQRVKLGELADKHMRVLRLLTDEQDENARLRAELDRRITPSQLSRLRAELADMKLALVKTSTQLGAANAAIERGHSVLDDMEANGRTSWTLDLRAALKREQ